MTVDRAALGKSSRRKGSEAERAVQAYLREHGFPNASHITGQGRGDYEGLGDLVLECTVQETDMAGKLDQAMTDAVLLGYPRAVLVKRRRRATVARWYWIEELAPALNAYRRLTELETATASDMDIFEAGRRAGLTEAAGWAGRRAGLTEAAG